jgi:hypothetical protein
MAPWENRDQQNNYITHAFNAKESGRRRDLPFGAEIRRSGGIGFSGLGRYVEVISSARQLDSAINVV